MTHADAVTVGAAQITIEREALSEALAEMVRIP